MSTKGLIRRTEKFNHLKDSMPEVFSQTLNINEYLLVLCPHELLCNQIADLKLSFSEQYKTEPAIYPMAHLALVHFKAWNIMEEKILHRLKIVAQSTDSFKVEIKNFGSLPTHTIFLQVTTKKPIAGLMQSVKGLQKLLKADPEFDPHFIADPNIIIANKLLPWQYEKGWLEYKNKNFTGSFVANELTLLKRVNGAKKYQVKQKLVFEKINCTASQTAMF